jgi:Mrp family chromosome partitioning ATPase
MLEWIEQRRVGGVSGLSAAASWQKLRRLFNGKAKVVDGQASLRFAMQLGLERPADGRARRILLTAPGSGLLIRNAAQELAYTLAEQMGRRVLLVEADLGDTRRSTGPGLRELLAQGDGDVQAAIRSTAHERVFLLPLGSSTLASAVFSPPAFGAFLDEAGAGFDSLILMAAPVMGDPRSLAFARLVDHTLVLAYEGETYLTELESSLALLADCEAAGVGVVLAHEAAPEPAPMA